MADINLFTPRSMSPAFEKNMPVTTFIKDTFFGEVNLHPTEKIDMDFKKGGYIVAPFVAPRAGGVNVGRGGYETKSYIPPLIAPERPISPDVLQMRLPGEYIHTTMTPEERQDYYLQRDTQELHDSITRREEVMCGQLISTGKISVRQYASDDLDDYIDEDIDYQIPASNIVTLTGDEKWNGASAKIYENLEAGVEAVLQAGYTPEYCILGKNAWTEMRKDPTILEMMNKLKFDIGNLKPELRTKNGNGLKYCGTLTELGIDLYTYYAWYKDYDGTLKPIYPNDRFSILPSNFGSIEYAAITQIEDDEMFHTYEAARVPQIIINKGSNVKKLRLQSRPIPKPYDIAAITTYKVL
jgi:hypothetical protein